MDFPNDTIEIRYFSDEWGPFRFDFSDSLPDGTALSSCDVKCYTGKVKPGDDLTTEITEDIIDTVTVHTDAVSVTFQYPGDTYKGTSNTLLFEVTLDSGAKHVFYFYKVKVV